MNNQNWPVFDCTFCPAKCSTEQELVEHFQEYHVLHCNVCPMGFYSEDELREHALKGHNEMQYEEYDAVIDRKKEKQFSCEKCGKTFRDAWHKERHLKSQTRCSSDYQPNEGRKQVKLPPRVGTKKPSMCEKCDKTFNSTWHLADHMVVHSDEKPFKCDDCDAPFKRVDSLKRHRKKTRSCSICDGTFHCIGALNKHNKKVHEEQIFTSSKTDGS